METFVFNLEVRILIPPCRMSPSEHLTTEHRHHQFCQLSLWTQSVIKGKHGWICCPVAMSLTRNIANIIIYTNIDHSWKGYMTVFYYHTLVVLFLSLNCLQFPGFSTAWPLFIKKTNKPIYRTGGNKRVYTLCNACLVLHKTLCRTVAECNFF